LNNVLYTLNQVSYNYQLENNIYIKALNNINFSIKKGEAITIVGPSGCGKSTLLYLLSGLYKPTSGEITFEGKTLNTLNRKAVLILQDYGLFPWKTVEDNISIGLILNQKENGLSRKQIKEKTDEILRLLNIKEQAKKFPTQLSGGQRQRVAIGRALVMNPEVLLMDEPFSALDAVTKESLKNLIQNICKKRNLTLVFVTHNIEEAVKLGNRIIVFGKEPGIITSIIENTNPNTYHKVEKALGIGGNADET
jgi:NitT/TauT family transport system ATP-binding protein